MVNAFKGSELVLGVYDGVTEASDIDTVKELYKLYRDKGFDSILAAGSGTVVDIAKLVNIAVSGQPEDIKKCVGIGAIPNPLRPLGYIPVTSGSGKESSCEARLGDLYYSSGFLMPDLVTIDPRMMLTDVPDRMINTAMATLTYAAEAYAGKENNPLSGAYAHTAINFVMTHLVDVVKESFEEKGRLSVLKNMFNSGDGLVALANAAVMSGCVFSNMKEGTASKLGEEISRHSTIPKGIAKGIMLPYTLEYAASRNTRDLEKLMLPVAGLDVYCSTPAGQRFDSAIGKIRHLQNELYILTSSLVPRTLEDANFPEEMLKVIAESVGGDKSTGYDTDACRVILDHAFYGKPVTP